MEMDELRSRLALILAVEENKRTDWFEVERLARELQGNLLIDATPEVVHHYLDDGDIRRRDKAYAVRQREQVRRFVEFGDYDEGTSIPLWGCVVVLLIGAGLLMLLL
jgi:hypothetical protein